MTAPFVRSRPRTGFLIARPNQLAEHGGQRSMSGAKYSMEISKYAEMPSNIVEKLLGRK